MDITLDPKGTQLEGLQYLPGRLPLPGRGGTLPRGLRC